MIPKKVGAQSIGDYRSVSLLGPMYKIITKILTSRLKKLLGGVISIYQNAFVEGRKILDCLVANEVIDFKIKGGGDIVLKVDMMKAYNYVSWNFLDFVMTKMGFGPKGRKWIRVRIARASFRCFSTGP